MKKNFFSGLAIILPVVITLVVISFVVNLVTRPFVGMFNQFLHYHGTLNTPFFIFSGEQVSLFASKFFVLLLVLVITFLAGFLGRLFLIRYLIAIGDWIIHRIPLINKVYKATQDVVSTLFKENGQSFSQVVLVPFPYTNTLSIGMITQDNLPKTSDPEYRSLISVFVPGTPNPTMGFMLMYRKDQLIFLDIKVDDALKFLVSCGTISPNFSLKANK